MMDGRDPDEAIWRKAQQGDRQAYDLLRNKYRALVFSSIRAKAACLSTEVQEDLAQTTWIAVWKQLPTFQGVSRFTTWVYGIARNVTCDHLRRKETQNLSADSEEIRAACGEAAESPMEALTDQIALREVLEKLPENVRLV